MIIMWRCRGTPQDWIVPNSATHGTLHSHLLRMTTPPGNGQSSVRRHMVRPAGMQVVGSACRRSLLIALHIVRLTVQDVRLDQRCFAIRNPALHRRILEAIRHPKHRQRIPTQWTRCPASKSLPARLLFTATHDVEHSFARHMELKL